MTFNRPQGDDVDIQINIVANETQLKRSDAAIKGFAQGVDRLERGFNETAAAALNLQKQQTALADQTRTSISLAQRWDAELSKVRKQDAIAQIERDFIRAARSGENLEDVLVNIETRLKEVGATEADVSRVLTSAASVGTGVSPLTRIGTQLRGLPSVAIPGAGGLTTDAIGNITRLIGSISGPEGLPKFTAVLGKTRDVIGQVISAIGAPTAGLIGATVALALVIGKMREEFDRARQAAASTIENQQQIFNELSSGTKASIEAELKLSQERQRIADNDVAVAEAAVQQIIAANQERGTIGVAGIQKFFNLGGAGGEIQAAEDALNAARQAQSEATDQVNYYTEALQNSAQVLQNTARENAEAQAKAFDVEQQARLQLVLANATQDNLEAYDAQLTSLRAQKDALADFLQTERLSEDQYKALSIQYAELQSKVATLSGSIREEVAARDAERQAREYTKQQQAETVALIESYNRTIEQSTQQRAEREAAILGKLNDDIVKIAEKAALDAEKALERLEQQRAKLGTDLSRGERDADRQARQEDLEARLKYQREEAKSYRDHLRNLRDIREDAQAQEEELGRSRDFAGLRRLRLETNRNLRDENRQFAEQRAEREKAFAEQIQDEQRRREFERESRIIRFNDAIKDAEDQYQRQRILDERERQRALIASRNAAAAELTLNNEKHRATLNMQYKAINAELQIVSQGHAARLEMERRHQQALLAQAQALQIANFFGSLGSNLIKGLTGNTNNVNTTFNVNGGTSGAQQKNLEAFVDGRIAAVLSRIG